MRSSSPFTGGEGLWLLIAIIFLLLALLAASVGDAGAVVLPNPDPSAPHFTEGWWLQMLVLAVFSVGFGFVIVLFGRWLKRQDEADSKQDQRIEDLYAELNSSQKDLNQQLHSCQVHCATCRGDYVKREDFEGRMLRMEEMIVRIHERVDQVASKLGVPDDPRRNG